MTHHSHWSQKSKPRRERRAFLTVELDDQTMEAIRATRMDPRHDHLNDELLTGQDLVNVMQASPDQDIGPDFERGEMPVRDATVFTAPLSDDAMEWTRPAIDEALAEIERGDVLTLEQHRARMVE